MLVHYLARVVVIGTAAPSYDKAPKIDLDCGTKPEKDPRHSISLHLAPSATRLVQEKKVRESSILTIGHYLLCHIFETVSPVLLLVSPE